MIDTRYQSRDFSYRDANRNIGDGNGVPMGIPYPGQGFPPLDFPLLPGPLPPLIPPLPPMPFQFNSFQGLLPYGNFMLDPGNPSYADLLMDYNNRRRLPSQGAPSAPGVAAQTRPTARARPAAARHAPSVAGSSGLQNSPDVGVTGDSDQVSEDGSHHEEDDDLQSLVSGN